VEGEGEAGVGAAVTAAEGAGAVMEEEKEEQEEEEEEVLVVEEGAKVTDTTVVARDIGMVIVVGAMVEVEVGGLQTEGRGSEPPTKTCV
jgi:hypothetical protein